MGRHSKQRKGGKARAEKLSAERRSEIARGAALKRWHGMPPSKEPGKAYIYGIGPLLGPIKVGRAQDVRQRRIDLQMGNPEDIVCHFAIEVPYPHCRAVEHKVHHLLRKYAIRGEWFAVSAVQARSIAENARDECAAGHFQDDPEDGSTILVYLPKRQRDFIEDFATTHEIEINQAICMLVDRVLARDALETAERKAAHLGLRKHPPRRARWAFPAVDLD